MKIPLRLRLALFLLFFITASVQSLNAEPPDYLSPLEKSVVDEINRARTNPKGYSSFLKERRQYYHGKLLKIPGEGVIKTIEGIAALNEAMKFTRSLHPVPPLHPSRGMSAGARDHVKDQGRAVSVGHRGGDASQPWDRVSRYGTWENSVGENIAYGSDKARDIVIGFIVDDGVPGRDHRKNIFDPDFRVIGVACGPHGRYGTVCVITFAVGYQEKGGR